MPMNLCIQSGALMKGLDPHVHETLSRLKLLLVGGFSVMNSAAAGGRTQAGFTNVNPERE